PKLHRQTETCRSGPDGARDVSHQITDERKASAYLFHACRVDHHGAERTTLRRGRREPFTPGIVRGRAAIVREAARVAESIYSDHVALILDRARRQERIPVWPTTGGPVRDDQHRIHVRRHGAEQLGEAE